MNPYTKLRNRVARDFTPDVNGAHGVPHWNRVFSHGMRIADSDPAVDRHVVALFAFLHDARRMDEFEDVGHGARAVPYLHRLRKEGVFEATPEQIGQLVVAVTLHSDGIVTRDPTIQACWDADRLDLGRVGVMPRAELLGSEYAKRPDVIRAAWQGAQEPASLFDDR